MDITFEYILSLANLWLVFIAKLTSDPLAKIVNFIFLFVLKTSYAPNEHLLVFETLFLIGLRFCLVKDIILGVFELFKACSQHSIVSILSAGLKTLRLGIDLNPDNCSIGWCVGPSSPSPMAVSYTHLTLPTKRIV